MLKDLGLLKARARLMLRDAKSRDLVARAARPPIATRRARRVRARCARRCRPAQVRAAEPDASSPIGWRVNTWVKQGILLGFRFGDMVDASMDHGKLAVLRQGHAAAEEAGSRAPASASCPADRRCATARTSRRASSACRRCTSTSAPTIGEGIAHRLARARRIVRAGRRARARQRGGADRRRHRAGRRAAGHHRRRCARSAATPASTKARSSGRAR